MAGIVASGLLSIANVALGWRAGSTSVVAAGLEFAGDVLASAIVLAGIRLAAKPPDSNHPYGHGRIETLAGLMVGMILATGGAAICYRSVQKITEVHPPPAIFGAWPLGAAIVVKTVLSIAKFRTGRRIGSASLVADAWNDAVDILSAATALAALLVTISDPARFLAADHYGGFVVGLVVIFTGLRVIRDTTFDLIDTMPSAALLDRMRGVAAAVPGVWGVEKLFARKTGLQYHADLHLEVDPAMTVQASHDVATAVRIRIREEMPEVADVLVHVEPGKAPPERRVV